MIKPNRTSEILSMGSRTRTKDLVAAATILKVTRLGRPRFCCSPSASDAGGAEQAIDRHPVQTSDFVADTVGAKQISHPCVRDDAQRNTAGGEFAMQFMKHVGAGEIDVRRCRKVTNYHPDLGCGRRIKTAQDRFQDSVGVDVKQG